MAAIYQEARPFTFEQVVGQEHIKDVLLAALRRERTGHAYLFSGPREVGKTTTARLLAMAVNCEAPDAAARPCGVCESCQLVRRNHHPDVIELDAASNNSVDDVRDLREKVRLAAMRGGKRVWVLDEAHMLSRAAANALLKTLEEPPENLVFVLATTEPEKLPPTILSRCQHFRFRRLSEDEIASKMARLCREREVEAESAALALVARTADGAMRDAESLLERLLTSGEPITRQGVEDALGLPPQDRMEALASALAAGELSEVFALADALYRDGFAPSSLASHLTATLRDALYALVMAQSGAFRLELAENDLLRMIHALDDEAERFARRDDLFALEVALIKTLNALAHNVPSEAVAPLTAAATAPLGSATRQPPQTAPAQPKAQLPDFDPHAAPKLAPKPVAAGSGGHKAPPPASATTAASGSNSRPTVSWHKVKT
ncbi:MAG TPA: DNA polymerase III subunit gamma/tau, partial [Chloroflexota bacterium]|nr:DNA polymerase III subunit gamma/tau [Chloroflexota bacterium]